MGLAVDGMPSTELLKEKFPHGHGRLTQYSTMGLADPLRIARLSNVLQRYFVEETRLGIPVALQTENLCGYPAMGGTMFPSQMNAACTWEPEAVEQMSRIIGQESKAVGINSAMSPVIDIVRDHRWGRVYETYGEDPYLTSQMGIHYIKGMQGDKEHGVACIAKHFLGYSETQGGAQHGHDQAHGPGTLRGVCDSVRGSHAGGGRQLRDGKLCGDRRHVRGGK